jgi:hypothetical protein
MNRPAVAEYSWDLTLCANEIPLHVTRDAPGQYVPRVDEVDLAAATGISAATLREQIESLERERLLSPVTEEGIYRLTRDEALSLVALNGGRLQQAVLIHRKITAAFDQAGPLLRTVIEQIATGPAHVPAVRPFSGGDLRPHVFRAASLVKDASASAWDRSFVPYIGASRPASYMVAPPPIPKLAGWLQRPCAYLMVAGGHRLDDRLAQIRAWVGGAAVFWVEVRNEGILDRLLECLRRESPVGVLVGASDYFKQREAVLRVCDAARIPAAAVQTFGPAGLRNALCVLEACVREPPLSAEPSATEDRSRAPATVSSAAASEQAEAGKVAGHGEVRTPAVPAALETRPVAGATATPATPPTSGPSVPEEVPPWLRGLPRERQEFKRQERARIVECLETCRWNVTRAVSLLKMPRRTLYRRLVEYGLAKEHPANKKAPGAVRPAVAKKTAPRPPVKKLSPRQPTRTPPSQPSQSSQPRVPEQAPVPEAVPVAVQAPAPTPAPTATPRQAALPRPTFHTERCDDHLGYVGLSPQFPSLRWFACTRVEAHTGIRLAVREITRKTPAGDPGKRSP